jgi:hypothetical protein
MSHNRWKGSDRPISLKGLNMALDDAQIGILQSHSGTGLPFRISLEAVNRAVGLVALGLPFALLLVWALGGSCDGIDSISHYYYTRVGGDLLVGSLSFIGLLLMFFYKLPGRGKTVDGYLGHHWLDIWAVRFAGLCALGVALVPTSGTGCEVFDESVARVFFSTAIGAPGVENVWTAGFNFWSTFGVTGGVLTLVHYASAAGMFAVLAYFSLIVFPRPQSAAVVDAESHTLIDKKKFRNRIYRVCGGLILLALAVLGLKAALLEDGSSQLEAWNNRNLTFWFEALGLWAFGASWSVKGRIFGFFLNPGETVMPA